MVYIAASVAMPPNEWAEEMIQIGRSKEALKRVAIKQSKLSQK